MLLGQNCYHPLLRQFSFLFGVGQNYSHKKTPLGMTLFCNNRLTLYTLVTFGKKIIVEVLL